MELIKILVETLLKGIAFAVLTVALIVGLFQGSIYVFGRTQVESSLQNTLASAEAIRVTYNRESHWNELVQEKVAKAWVSTHCPQGDVVIYQGKSFSDEMTTSCVSGGGGVYFVPNGKTLNDGGEYLGSNKNRLALSTLYVFSDLHKKVGLRELISYWVGL